MNPRIATLIALCCCLQSSLSVAAETNSASAADVKLVQGLWERELTPADNDAGLRRATKEIAGNKETVTFYGENDKILRRHVVDFKLGKNGDVHVFTYSNMEITEGEGKGTKSTDSFSYVYRADQESFLEVSGLLPGQQDEAVTVVRWKRVKK
jgi:hypothetical protein